jgi:3-oxoacyl-[acyl-carrier-protein] synthase II
MRPFDKDRAGTVLGDGGALFMMESLDAALERKAKIYCEVVGYRANCIGYHAVRPDMTGNASFKTIRGAMLEANLAPKDIDVFNAHATSTQVGDTAELNCIKKVFYNESTYNDLQAFKNCDPNEIDLTGHWKPKENKLAITAYKGNIGHLQLASGAVESAFIFKSMENNINTYIKNLENPEDDRIDFVRDANKK